MCHVRSRPSLTLAGASRVPGGEAAYLCSEGLDVAARIMGSRDRAQAVLDGASVESVINAGKEPMYRLRRLGGAAQHPLLLAGAGGDPGQSAPQTSAYEIAKAGGAHSGLLRNYRDTAGLRQIRHGIDTMTRRIQEHRRWIDDPSLKLPSSVQAEAVDRYVRDKWPSDIRRLTAERDVLQGLLKEKDDG